MIGFLFGLAILLQCGIFPMSPDDCRSTPRTAVAPPPAIVTVEAP